MAVFHLVKAYKKGNGIALNVTGMVAKAVSLSAGSYELGRDGDNLILRRAKTGILMTIAGVDCYTWQDVAYVASREWERERAATGAGSGSPGGENGGDVYAGGSEGLF